MSNEMTVYEANQDIAIYRAPDVVLAEATTAAKALSTVLAGKKKKVMMNGEQYLEFEDWQTVGRFYGVTAKIVSTNFVDFGGVQGFEARAVAVRADGAEISAAESMCLNDEEKWSARPKYRNYYILRDGSKQEEDPPKDQIVWIPNPNKPGSKMPKRERERVGDEKVPLFQLKSMAQTRACAKVLRNVLAWVVVLAGYRPTPAEELDGKTTVVDQDGNGEQGTESTGQKTPIAEPQKKATGEPSGNAPAGAETVTVQVKSIFQKPGEKDGKKYVKYTIVDTADVSYGTFSDTIAVEAKKAQGSGAAVKISFNVGKYGKDIVTLELDVPEEVG